MPGRLPNWFLNLSLLFASVFLFLSTLEIGLRLTGVDRGRPRTPPIYEKSTNPEISYQLKPRLQETAFRANVTTNSVGIRSPEVDSKKPSIALLGDSITFGYGLSDTETLGARLSSVLSEQYNVLNAAVPGYNLVQEAAIYREKIAPLAPQTLVLVFYWNDLQDMTNAVLDEEGILRQPGWTPADERCNPIETGILSYLPGRCWLDSHSALYRTLKKIASARQEQKNLAAQREESKQNPEHDSVDPKNLARYQELFTAFARSLSPDLKKIFVIWPDKEFHTKTVPVLKTMAETNGFRVIDLYETFGNDAETLSWDTVHPSAETVKKAATIIAGYLSTQADRH